MIRRLVMPLAGLVLAAGAGSCDRSNDRTQVNQSAQTRPLIETLLGESYFSSGDGMYEIPMKRCSPIGYVDLEFKIKDEFFWEDVETWSKFGGWYMGMKADSERYKHEDIVDFYFGVDSNRDLENHDKNITVIRKLISVRMIKKGSGKLDFYLNEAQTDILRKGYERIRGENGFLEYAKDEARAVLTTRKFEDGRIYVFRGDACPEEENDGAEEMAKRAVEDIKMRLRGMKFSKN